VFLDADFFGADFLVLDEDFFGADFFAALLVADFLDADFLGAELLEDEDLPEDEEEDFLEDEEDDEDFFFGTFAPSFLASDKPIAIACLRLVTFLPLPLFNVPSFFSCIAFSTLSPAFFEYFAMILNLMVNNIPLD